MAADLTLTRPIFVVGCPRSGTTLVQCLLSASPRAFSLPETHFFSEVLPYLGVGLEARLGPEQLRRGLERLAYSAEVTLPAELVARLDAAARAGALGPLDLFLAVLEEFRPAADAGRCLRVVEKTPLHVLHLEEIGAAFAEARFVNVVRSPVDVAASWLGTPFARTGSMLFYAQVWSECVLAAERYARRAPERIHTLVYERLIAEPERALRRLCGFLELPYEDRLLHEFGREAARNVNKREDWKQDIERGVIVNRAGNWRGRLAPGQAWLIALATRRVGRRYGYGALPRAGPAAVARAVATEARTRFHEGRQTTGRWASVRHAAAGFRALPRFGG
jgi:Sulfotransferase family